MDGDVCRPSRNGSCIGNCAFEPVRPGGGFPQGAKKKATEETSAEERLRRESFGEKESKGPPTGATTLPKWIFVTLVRPMPVKFSEVERQRRTKKSRWWWRKRKSVELVGLSQDKR